MEVLKCFQILEQQRLKETLLDFLIDKISLAKPSGTTTNVNIWNFSFNKFGILTNLGLDAIILLDVLLRDLELEIVITILKAINEKKYHLSI